MHKVIYIIPIMLLLLSLGCINDQAKQGENNEKINIGNNKEIIEKETKLEVNPQVVITSSPKTANINDNVYFQWQIKNAVGEVKSTEVYYGMESNKVTEFTAPSETSYNEYAMDLSGSFEVPGTFETNFNINQPGVYYARAHTYINGKHYWSDEVSFEMLGENGNKVKEFIINVNKDGFEKGEIKIPKNSHVIIRFQIGEDVDKNGVIITGAKIDSSEVLKPGDSYRIEFDADQKSVINLIKIVGRLPISKMTIEVE